MISGSNFSDNYRGSFCGVAGRGLPDRLSAVLLMSHLYVRTGAIQSGSGEKVRILGSDSIYLCEKK